MFAEAMGSPIASLCLNWKKATGLLLPPLNKTTSVTNFRFPSSQTVAQGVIGRDEDENRFKTTSVFSLYPHPTDGKININFDQDFQGKSTIEAFNILGTRLTSKTVQDLKQGESLTIDLQHFAPGIYIIKLCNDEGCWSQKVSVK